MRNGISLKCDSFKNLVERQDAEKRGKKREMEFRRRIQGAIFCVFSSFFSLRLCVSAFNHLLSEHKPLDLQCPSFADIFRRL